MFAVVIKGVKGVEEFFLALLAFAQELNVVDYEHINGSKLTLKTGQISLLDGPDKSVDEIFTAQEPDYFAVGFLSCLVTDSVQEVSFSQTRITVKKKRIVCITRGLADGNAACVGKAVARPDNEVIKCIIGMELWSGTAQGSGRFFVSGNVEIDRDEMARYVLSGAGERAFAIIMEVLDSLFIRTSNSERTTVKMHDRQFLEPFSAVGRVE